MELGRLYARRGPCQYLVSVGSPGCSSREQRIAVLIPPLMKRTNFRASDFAPGEFDVLFLDPPSNIATWHNMMNFMRGHDLHTLGIKTIVAVFDGTAGYAIQFPDGPVICHEENCDWLAPEPTFPNARNVNSIALLLSRTQGRILDPFAGSGSTLVAARLLARDAVGVEPELRCHHIYADLLERHQFVATDYYGY